MKTQKERILQRIKENGSICNFWAVKNYILRLSERIRELEADGHEFGRWYGKGANRRNYYYYKVP